MLGLLKTEIFSTYNPQDYAQAKQALAQAGITPDVLRSMYSSEPEFDYAE